MKISAHETSPLSTHAVVVKEGKALERVLWANTETKTCLVTVNHLKHVEMSYDRLVVRNDVQGLTPVYIDECQAEGIEFLPPVEVGKILQAAQEG